MDSAAHVPSSPQKLMSTSLWLCVLLCTVSVKGDYQFTIRFYEFRNPLGLQCSECESGGQPSCCDQQGNASSNCRNNRPYNCDTRFRFLLRPFRASVETAPNTGFPHYTPSNGNNSEVFSEGPGGLLALPNPFTIKNTSAWTGEIQFYVDAVDRAVPDSGLNEVLAIINHFPINLELTPGPNFTERTTYTGFYNISGVEFDMSFKVQCFQNYYGPNCTTFCEQMEGVYTCDREGRVVCINERRDHATNCIMCLQGWDLNTNCATCLPGYDPSTNCTECLPNVQCQPTQTSTDSAVSSTSNSAIKSNNLAVVGGAVGGAAGILVIFLVAVCVVIIIMVFQLRYQRKTFTISGTNTHANNSSFSRDSSVKERTETTRFFGEHELENPLYDASKQTGSQWEADNSAYSKLQHPPVQKSFAPPKFPYVEEQSEETSYQLDVAGKGRDDTLNSGLHPPYDIAYPPPSFNETEGGAYDVTHHPKHQVPGPSPSAVAGGIYNLPDYSQLAVYDEANLPPRESTQLPRHNYDHIDDTQSGSQAVTTAPLSQYDYADIPDPQKSTASDYDYADTAVSRPYPADVSTTYHEYAETEEVVKPSELSQPPSVAYANTTPGKITPEAMNHYDLGQY